MIHARADYAPIQDPRGLIPEDEPVVLLRGQDVSTVPAMRAWLSDYQDQGGDDPALIGAIEEHIVRVLAWQQEHMAKVADLPEGVEPASNRPRFLILPLPDVDYTTRYAVVFIDTDATEGELWATCGSQYQARITCDVLAAHYRRPAPGTAVYGAEPF